MCQIGLGEATSSGFCFPFFWGFVGSFRLYPNFGDKKHSKNTVDWRLKKQNGFNTQALLRSDVVGTMFIYVVKYTYEIIYIYVYIRIYNICICTYTHYISVEHPEPHCICSLCRLVLFGGGLKP